MAPAEEDLDASSYLLQNAISRPRGAAEQERILADDRLVEGLRTGRITEDNATCPLARLLARWRRQVAGG
jgi:hypothetical protein